MIWQVVLGLWMAAVVIASFLYVPPAVGLGELGRIIIYHVPAAWIAVLAYLMAMVNSITYLRNGDVRLDRQAKINNELGTVFCILATITGAIWSKASWGMYWNWDPRQTSIAVLLLIYAAYFVLRGAISDTDRRARLAAVYSVLAFITVPFLVFIVPRVYASLHPDYIGRGKMQIDGRMLRVFLASLAGFTGLYAWLYRIQARLETLLYRMQIKREA